MKLRLFLIFLLILTLFAPVGCAQEDSSVILLPYSQPSVDKKAITVNISSLVIHRSEVCHHIANTDEDNLRYVEDTSDAINALLDMGYRFCSSCEDSKT
ncbi:MAG: hypothetical protein IJW46_06300 [Clostridia bacterium]|nr:hypothetical protein [Clostridia bacterium]